MRKHLALSTAITTLFSVGALAQPAGFDAETHREMLNKMMECSAWSEAECADTCSAATRSFSDVVAGDQDAITECRKLYVPAEARGRRFIATNLPRPGSSHRFGVVPSTL